MSGQPPAIGKQRTRSHVIADLSVNHVERYILEAGHTAQRWHADYGYDLTMKTYDEQGLIEPGLIYFQLKATEQLPEAAEEFPFDIDVRDYNLWTREVNPVLFCLFDASRKRAYYIQVHEYFREVPSRRPGTDARTVRVFIPRSQPFNRRAIQRLRRRANEVVRPLDWRVIS